MKIPLTDFEQYIEDDVLKKGLSYFRNNHVHEPEEISPGVFEAMVEGTDEYTVRLTIEKRIITGSSCNLPYDFGPICKHIVAVIFYLQQDETGITPKKSSSPKPKAAKKKTKSDKSNELLEQISHEELKKFIREKAETDTAFRNSFLSSFAYMNISESKDLYKKQIRAILKSATGREKILWGYRATQAGKEVSEFLTTARKHLESENLMSTIYVCQAVMEELTDTINYADDSSGYFGNSIYGAFELLMDLAESELQEELRKMLFEYCTSSFERRIFSGWDWHLGMMEMASMLMNDEKESQKILKLLDTIPESRFEKKEALHIKFHIIEQTKSEDEVEEFISNNLSDEYFRHHAITRAINNKKYELAIKLAQDGIELDSKERPGLVDDWHDRLLDIALNMEDKVKIVEYSRKIFINDFKYSKDYYRLMKENVKPEKWDDFVENLITKLTPGERWPNFNLIAKVFIREEKWERLLKHISIEPSLNVLDTYEKYLSPLYPMEVANLYSKCIMEYLVQNTGRNHYKTACRYLRRMKKLGAAQEVEKLVQLFKERYKLRKALIEELERV